MNEIIPRKESLLCLALLLAAVVCQKAHGQYCVDQWGNRVPCQPQASNRQVMYGELPHVSRCRIHVQTGGGTQDVGSGTLVDNRTGLIITAAHLFRESRNGIVATFPNGRRFEARYVAEDTDADLAAIRIRPTDIETRPIDTSEQTGVLTAGGFGPNGSFAPARGKIVDRQQAQGGTPVVFISAPVRQGDSGGGVFNENKHFVGVAWGCSNDGQAAITCGRPLAQFLDRVFPNRTGAIIARATPRSYGSPGGTYQGQQPGYYGEAPPLEPVRPIPQQPPQYQNPVADIDHNPPAPQPDIDWDAWGDAQAEQQQEIKDGQDEIKSDLDLLAGTSKQQQQLTVAIHQAVQGDSKLEAEQLAALQRISEALIAMNDSQSEINMHLTNISGRISQIESQPATTPTAPAGQQISYYDIVPRKKP